MVGLANKLNTTKKKEIVNNKDNVINLKIIQLHQMPISPCMRAEQKTWQHFNF